MILLLGAVIAGVSCYESTGHGPPMAGQPAPEPVRTHRSKVMAAGRPDSDA